MVIQESLEPGREKAREDYDSLNGGFPSLLLIFLSFLLSSVSEVPGLLAGCSGLGGA